MKLEQIKGDFAVCQLENREDAPFCGPFVSLTATPEELSLVCREEDAPKDCIRRENGWVCLKIAGTLDFSLVGILSRLSGILAENGISIFAVSTYNTDYILVKRETLARAAAVLQKHGYEFAV